MDGVGLRGRLSAAAAVVLRDGSLQRLRGGPLLLQLLGGGALHPLQALAALQQGAVVLEPAHDVRAAQAGLRLQLAVLVGGRPLGPAEHLEGFTVGWGVREGVGGRVASLCCLVMLGEPLQCPFVKSLLKTHLFSLAFNSIQVLLLSVSFCFSLNRF